MAETSYELGRVEALIEGGTGVDVAASRGFCRSITANAGSSFGVGIRLTPSRCRDGMHALYAWMRLADDAADADAPAEEREAVLDRFAELTDLALAGKPRAVGVWPAVSAAVEAYGLEGDWLRALLAGVRQDLEAIAFERDAELAEYCDRVAGNVGRCCVAIWGVRGGAHRAGALALAGMRGRAFQLINIARDLEEDARAGRRYVPGERLSRLGVSLGDRAVREDLLREGLDLLESSRPLEGMVRRDAGPALWAMTRAYTLIAHRLRGPGGNVSLGSGAKLGIAAGALGRRVLAAGRLA